MSKYVISFEDNPWYQDECVGYYKCGEIPWWSAKKTDIKKLTPLDKALNEHYQRGLEEGKKQAKVQAHLDVCHDIDMVAHGNYQKGLDDAWEAITKIAKMHDGEMEKVFGDCRISNILNKFSTSEIINILDGYDPEKDEIKVGDEVIPIDAIRRPFVVVSIENDVINGFDLADGYTPRGCHRDETRWEKTGRHFPQVAELVKAMKEGVE